MKKLITAFALLLVFAFTGCAEIDQTEPRVSFRSRTMNCGNAVSKSSFSVASAGRVSGHSWTAQEADNAIAASEAVIIFNAFLIYPPHFFKVKTV